MLIKSITCHNVYNYGATLQAYALQSYIESLEHAMEIIDYSPYYLNRAYNFWYFPPQHKYYHIISKFFILRLAYALKYYPTRFATKGRIKPFKEFNRNYLKCTQQKYKSIIELRNNPPIADVYIAGSDQIWNPQLPNGKDPAFFLDFGIRSTKRISYAASIAIDYIPKEYWMFFQNQLSKFDAISVREKTGIELLSQLNIYNCILAIDPVFLLSKEKWEKIIPQNINFKIKKKYILIYDIFNDNPELQKIVCCLAIQENLDIIAINDSCKIKYADYNIDNGGPLEFLFLIKNADYVISNSFHATAFSIILHKEFYVFYSKGGGSSSRITDLLNTISIENRFNCSLQLPLKKINWFLTDKLLKKQIENGMDFIKTSLKKGK